MKWTMTTATYRFHLFTFAELVALARQSGFKAIELWEPHLIRHRNAIMRCQEREDALPIVALSGYLDATDESIHAKIWSDRLEEKLSGCEMLNIPCLRLFTGNLSSISAEESDWHRFVDRLRRAQELAERYRTDIVFETHPGTLLDRVQAVERFLFFIEAEQWSRIGLNFDAFHVWEFNADPATCLMRWHPHVKHVHLKNARMRTEQFAFHNVYHPAGNFDELCALDEGVYDIRSILHFLRSQQYQGALTLEWFGLPDEQLFREEISRLNEQASQAKELFA